jgi:hypothetical protein
VAEAAGNGSVLAGQRETGGAVGERSSRPGGNGVAGGTLCCGGRETSRDVVRNISADGGGALKSSGVAAVAIRGVQGVVVIGMAGSARCCEVRAHQRKPGDAVVEGGRIPTCGGVAVRAIADGKGRTSGRVHRIVGSLPGSQVALRISAAVEGNL